MEAGDIKSQTSLNTTDVETDLGFTNWADDDVKTVTVKVSAAGAVTYEIDGSTDGSAVAMSFDTGDVVIPCMVFCEGGSAADTPPILETYYCGLQ